VAEAAGVAAQLATADDADDHLRMDVRRDRLVLTLQSRDVAWPTARDVELARSISARVAELGLRTEPDADGSGPRAAQVLEIAIDAMDIPSIRPFWKAVLGYVDFADDAGPTGALIDPLWEGPAIWFQQMDKPRPQRNRIHFDVAVPHDEAQRRLDAALAAGGTLVSDKAAPSFWVLADPEGNEICICTWQDRD
jgi:4a-hydroxytetrahydrobiopterin dehydratase